jgi:tRNA(His) 5'-end guanylyltransferase
MKSNYENRTRFKLTRRTPTIIRIDGKAFHTYTKGLERPFDLALMEDMDETAKYLCKNIQNCKFAYIQSDEISLFLSDWDTSTTDAWFDYNIQKMCSVSASMATSKFNEQRVKRAYENTTESIDWNGFKFPKSAEFDSRVFQVPFSEINNYFLWRQQDATRNSIASVAQSMYSHKELFGKNTDQMQELIFQKGTNWNDYTPYFKRGRVVKKVEVQVNDAVRSKWEVDMGIPVFSQSPDYLMSLIPQQ